MANSTADGSVVLDVDMNISQAEKRLGKLREDIKKTEKEIADMTKARDEAKEKSLFQAAELDTEKAKLQDIKNQLAEIRALSKDKSLSMEQRKAYEAQIPALKQDYDEQKARVSALQAEWNRTESSVDSYNRKIDAANQKLDEQKTAAGILVQQIEEAARAQNGFSSASAAAKKALNGILKVFASITKSALFLAKTALKKIVSSFGGVFKSSKGMNNSFSAGIKTMLKYGLGIRSLFTLFKKLRSAIAEGMKNLASYSGEVNESLSMLKSNLTQLKNGLATAFAPILTSVAPVLAKLISMCSAAADAIARLLAMLGGKTTYTRAIAVQEEYADAIKGTGGAADDAAKSMANFDEINQLTEKDKGGGGAGADAEDMFETVDIDPFVFESWGEAFSVMLDGILNDGIPRLKEWAWCSAGSQRRNVR